MKVRKQLKKVKTRHLAKRLGLDNIFKRIWRYLTKKPKKGYSYYTGRISLLHPVEDLKKGHVVITPFGIGTIFERFPMNGPKLYKGRKIEVYLRRKYYKAFDIAQVYQYYVYNVLFDKHIPLMSDCYQYIVGQNDQVEYRITDRGLADLSPEEKQRRKYVSIFSNKRGGRTLMKKLLNEGYKIYKDEK